ncbi:methyl-accepting chemotaxis protein [Eubacterium oxidoreducens]|uniref:Methyl-accepting chemotaxis protein (MCP) signalling domain-containing protein n=1 Tax=Eubacterium oxidoreducens TaxID=1732 RepID=A0A1G6C053_EUBOX|nr:methyl-accepting chemotaxis protein [Eubacterium oxidoreducens]SDB26217.1 Methyl-accepting chemotaxis protein (MCP) signalling domain-containing protein [Eubacterium oxidoreducens]
MFGKKDRKREIDNEKQLVREEYEAKSKKAFGVAEQIKGNCIVAQDNQKLLDQNLTQIVDNIKVMHNKARSQADTNARLSEIAAQMSREAREDIAGQMEIIELFEKEKDALYKVVDANKHFTTPAKALSQFGSQLDTQMRQLRNLHEKAAQFSKEMSVTALNAAIEAGRLGNVGQQFMIAAQDVRDLAENYENITKGINAAIKQIEEEKVEYEKQLSHLNNLLKENNIQMGKNATSFEQLEQKVNTLELNPIGQLAQQLDEQSEAQHESTAEINKAAQDSLNKIEQTGRVFIEQMESLQGMQQQSVELMEMLDVPSEREEEHE